MEALQSMQQEIQSISMELQGIQQATFEANPELVEEQDRFRMLVLGEMDKQGAQVDETVRSMRADQAALEGGELDAEAQQETMARLQSNGQALEAARQEAMQKPAVIEANAELEKKILAAMNETDPRTDELIARLDAAHEAFNAALRDAMAEEAGGNE